MIDLIIEDGTGVPDSNSYIDEAYAKDYFILNGSTLWEDNCHLQKLALVQASSFFDLRYSTRFCGDVVNVDQGLLFPRSIHGTSTGIPKQLKNAVASLALLFMQDGVLDLNANSDNAIKSSSVSVGNGAVQETLTYYDKPASKTPFSYFSVTDRYIDQLMKSVGCESRSNSSMFIEAYRS